MLARQRQELILDSVRSTGGVRVSELVDRLGVSDMTVRRGRYVFVLNRGDLPASVPATGVDLLTGDRADGELRVAAGTAAVVESDEG